MNDFGAILAKCFYIFRRGLNKTTMWRDRTVEFTCLTAEIVLSGEDVDGDTLSNVLVDLPKHGQLYSTLRG